MSVHFQQEMNQLKEKILRMGARVEEAIRDSVEALKTRDAEKAKQVIASDKQIDALEIEIDEACHQLLALYQPVASDMRFITSTLKMTSDLERMGDLAVNISERVLSLIQEPPLKPLIDIPRLAEIAQEMVRRSLDALVHLDAAGAKQVCEQDDVADQLHEQIVRELISYMLEDKNNIRRALDLISVSRQLERIADHATNVAEDVIYLVQGKDIRHHHEES